MVYARPMPSRIDSHYVGKADWPQKNIRYFSREGKAERNVKWFSDRKIARLTGRNVGEILPQPKFGVSGIRSLNNRLKSCSVQRALVERLLMKPVFSNSVMKLGSMNASGLWFHTSGRCCATYS